MNEEISDQDILDQVAGYEASVPSIRAAEEAHQAAVEDLQEATFAAMRRVLEQVVDTIEAGRIVRWVFADGAMPATEDAREFTRRLDAVYTGIKAALEPETGRTFLAHMQRLEAENAIFREDVPRYLAENIRIRGLLAALESCPHGCQDAGYCSHYARLRRLGLRA